MTRILVCGASIFDDPDYVRHALTEVHRAYGPVTCVIHNHHTQAIAWQQWIARKEAVKHLPVIEDYRRDGVMAGARCRDRMFEARPDFVVVFEIAPDKDDLTPLSKEAKKAPPRRPKTELIVHRALERNIQVLRYTYDPVAEKVRKAAAAAAERQLKLDAKLARASAKAARKPKEERLTQQEHDVIFDLIVDRRERVSP